MTSSNRFIMQFEGKVRDRVKIFRFFYFCSSIFQFFRILRIDWYKNGQKVKTFTRSLISGMKFAWSFEALKF